MTIAAVVGLPIAAGVSLATGLWWVLPAGLPLALLAGVVIGAVAARASRTRSGQCEV